MRIPLKEGAGESNSQRLFALGGEGLTKVACVLRLDGWEPIP